MNKFSHFFVAASVMLLPVLAEEDRGRSGREGRGKPMNHKRGPGGGFGEMLEKLDRDSDQAVSFEEFSAGPRVKNLPEEYREKLFRRFDKNEDGVLTKADKPAGGERRGKRPPLDLDGNGEVTFEEFQKSGRISQLAPDRQREVFDRMDRNSDGILNREDWRGRRGEKGGPGPGTKRPPVHLDENEDGKISFEEFRKHPRHAELSEDDQEDRFEALDKNGDGFIDESERPQGPPRGMKPPGREGRTDRGGKGQGKPGPPRGPQG